MVILSVPQIIPSVIYNHQKNVCVFAISLTWRKSGRDLPEALHFPILSWLEGMVWEEVQGLEWGPGVGHISMTGSNSHSMGLSWPHMLPGSMTSCNPV